MSRFALVAQLAGDVRLAKTIAFAIVGWEDPAGIARAGHAIGELAVTGSALVALVPRVTRFAITSACYLEHDRCLNSRMVQKLILVHLHFVVGCKKIAFYIFRRIKVRWPIFTKYML